MVMGLSACRVAVIVKIMFWGRDLLTLVVESLPSNLIRGELGSCSFVCMMACGMAVNG